MRHVRFTFDMMNWHRSCSLISHEVGYEGLLRILEITLKTFTGTGNLILETCEVRLSNCKRNVKRYYMEKIS